MRFYDEQELHRYLHFHRDELGEKISKMIGRNVEFICNQYEIKKRWSGPRADMAFETNDGTLVIVELKNVKIGMFSGFYQIRHYLEAARENNKDCIGILIGPNFTKPVLEEIEADDSLYGMYI